MTEERVKMTSRKDKAQILDYNNPLFYCFAEKCSFTSDTIHIMPEHWHEDIEYLYVAEGRMEYNINGEIIPLRAGEGICVNSKRIHSNRSVKGEYCIFYCAIIHPSYLCVSPYIEQKYVEPLLRFGSFDYLLLKKNDWTAQILNELVRLFEVSDEACRELEILEASFRILRILYRNIKPEAAGNTPSVQYANTFKTMVSFIQEHYMDKISLEEIAMAGNVGKTLCAKIFKKFTSRTPGDYLINYRITRGIELLKETDLSVTEISYATGFNSASHFTRTFRELVGCTPNKCRASERDPGRFVRHS